MRYFSNDLAEADFFLDEETWQAYPVRLARRVLFSWPPGGFIVHLVNLPYLSA